MSVSSFANPSSIHNLSVANHKIHDPILTPLGKEQARRVNRTFPYKSTIELVVCSPLRRTIYTALLGFKTEIDHGVKLIALPESQETADVPCDTGSARSVLEKEFGGKHVDLSLVTEDWNSKTGRWAPTRDAIEKRARETRQWLKARPEKEIVLVTHGGFLHFLTEDWSDYSKVSGTGWANTEFRSFTFVDEEGDNATIVETAESKKFRRGREKPLSDEELMEYRETTTKTLENGRSHPLLKKVH